MAHSKKHKLSAWRFLAIGYLIVILTGSFLLSLPVSARSGTWTNYLDALFTSASATCVTGLVVYDTFTHWAPFGQVVLLLLIQVGGIGFMTIVTLVLMALRRRIGLYQRKVIIQSAGKNFLSGAVSFIKRILVGTLLFEGAGTILLAIRFCGDMGFGEGLYFALFHSVSAFCNAGFDLMGKYEAFSSLTRYAGDPLVNLTVMALIFFGGLGFLVWSDVFECRGNPRKFSLHTRLALVTTAFLIVVPTFLFYWFERDRLFAGMDFGNALLRSLFCAVTPRTAGFNTVALADMTEASRFLTSVLMLIGGNSGSTAGGIKITTFVFLLYSAVAVARRDEEVDIGRKRFGDSLVREACGTVTVYLVLVVFGCLFLLGAENGLTLSQALVEVVSAVCTVGLSTGITPTLGVASKGVLIVLMFAGRVGVMSLAIALGERKKPPLKRPADEFLIG